MTGTRPGTIWLLTDRRYLEQRMPLAVADWLESAGHPARLVVADEPSEAASLAAPSGPWDGLEAGDVVVGRSRHPHAFALLEIAEALGARTVDSASAVLRVRNKVHCTTALARRSVPIPPTYVVGRPTDLESVPAAAYPLILKPVHGDNARGLRVVSDPGDLASVRWPDDVVLAQSYLDAHGVDLKVYVVDDSIWAVRRPSPLSHAAGAPAAAPVTPTLRELVGACRSEFGLRLFGLDVLEVEHGPVVVDVNEFPNYTGVEEAPAAIGRALVDAAGGGRLLEPAQVLVQA